MLALPLIATTLLTQGIQARFDPAPDIAQFVAPAHRHAIPLGGPRFDEAYCPFESIAVRRNGTPQARKVRNVVYGAVGGFLSAMLVSAVSMYVDAPTCALGGRDCGNGFWPRTGDIAVYTVPLGALIGFVTTTWTAESRRH